MDKALLIKDFLDTRAKVTLFTRPRRFGKTLNMDMPSRFFLKDRQKILPCISVIKRSGVAYDYRKHQGNIRHISHL